MLHPVPWLGAATEADRSKEPDLPDFMDSGDAHLDVHTVLGRQAGYRRGTDVVDRARLASQGIAQRPCQPLEVRRHCA